MMHFTLSIRSDVIVGSSSFRGAKCVGVLFDGRWYVGPSVTDVCNKAHWQAVKGKRAVGKQMADDAKAF